MLSMKFLDDLNNKTTQFINIVEQVKIENITLYIMMISIISGIIFGAFEFIERNYATGYVLDIVSKLWGILNASSWMAIYSFIIGIKISIVVFICLYLMIYVFRTFKKDDNGLWYTWLVPIIIFTTISTIIIVVCYFLESDSAFTNYVLYNGMIKVAILFKPFVFLSLIFAGLISFYVENKFNKSFITTFFISTIILIFLSSGFIYEFIGLLNIFIILNKLYLNLLELYNSVPWLLVAGLYILFLILNAFWIVVSVVTLPKLWKSKLIRAILLLCLFLLFAGFYFFTVNYLVGQTFYVKPIREIHYVTGLLSLLYFNFFVLFLFSLSGIRPGLFNNFKEKHSWMFLMLAVILIVVLSSLLIPFNNRLKAFIDKGYIVQKQLSDEWFNVSFLDKKKKSFTPAIKDKYITYPIPLNKNTKDLPDIFLISIDALRTDYALNKEYAPNINEFLENSYFFINNYSPATHTPASMSSIATSKLFAEPGDAYLPTMASLLHGAGYKTLAFVAMNLANPRLIMDKATIKDKQYPTPIIRGYESVLIDMEEKYNADEKMLKQFFKAVNSNQQSPLLVWLHLYQLHETPVNIVFKSFFSNKSFKKAYIKRLKYDDALFGKYINYLKKKDLYDKSLIVFYSDHGEEIKDHGSFFHTFSLYNELIKVPLAIKLPGQKEGKVIQKPVSTLDITPTILEYTGWKNDKKNFYGESLLNVIENESISHKLPLSAFYRGFYYPSKPALKIFGAILMNENPRKYFVKELYKYSIVDQNNKWKLIYNLVPEYYELYDLQKDPEEKNNLADEQPEIVKNLKKSIKTQIKDN